MKDNDLRGIMLEFFYQHRRSPRNLLSLSDFPKVFSEDGFREVHRICKQLEEYGYIKWAIYSSGDGQVGQGQITGSGVDVIEGNAQAAIAITVEQNSNVNVTGSSNVQIGNHNSMSNLIRVDALNTAIEDSSFSSADKEEAKSALSKFLEHPVIAAIVGGLASNVGK